MPQNKQQSARINCATNDGSWKSHFLTKQGSKNYFQWRIKRVSKAGNCTIRVSLDGKNYIPLTPTGFNSPKFTCGRSIGYESAEFRLPKSIISELGAVI